MLKGKSSYQKDAFSQAFATFDPMIISRPEEELAHWHTVWPALKSVLIVDQSGPLPPASPSN